MGGPEEANTQNAGTGGLALRTTALVDKFVRGKVYRLSPATKETLLLKIPRDVAAILRFRSRDQTADSDDDDDDDEGECGTPPDAEMTSRSDDDEKDVGVGLAIAPACFGIVRLTHMSKFGAELHNN